MTSPAPPDAGWARRLVLIILAIVVALGGAVWWFVLRDDAPPPAALGDCAAPAGTSTDRASGSWALEPGDVEDVFVGYRIDERFGGATVEKPATGRTGDVEGTLVVTDDAVTDAQVVAHLGSLQSNRTARDTAIRTKGLQTEQFPTATFTLTDPISLDSPPAKGASISVVAHGTLELHGQEQPAEVPLEACWTGPTIRLSGSAPIVLSDYGIEQISTPIVDIADHGQLELQLVFTPA